MKFLVDEDVPVKLIKRLADLGYQATRVPPSCKDRDIARHAKNQGCILVTLDKDFANRLLYPPSDFNIIYIRIHPPFADDLIASVQRLLQEVPESDLHGLIILHRDGNVRIVE